MVRTRLGLGFSGFSILTLFFVQAVAGCDSKSNGDDDDDDGGSSGEDASGGTSLTKGGTTGKGGSSSGGKSGATANGGSTNGGSTNGGSTNGGSTNGGSTNGGSGGTTGGTENGGTGADAGSSGDGSGDAGGSSANGGTGGTVIGPSCDAIDVKLELETPTVVLLVDTSTSMFEGIPPVYPMLHDSLMNAMTGVVEKLQDKMRFGFAAYQGHIGTSETDPACATMLTVDPALDNYAAIEDVYGAISWDAEAAGPKWETPTNYAITHTVASLEADMPDVPSNKYILLVTDGNPNTCQTVDPQCGQDYAIKAAQDAYAAGIGMMVLGIGDIVANPNSGCTSTYQRCGLLHLQDLANAGVGAPVMPPPNCDDPASASCVAKFEACNIDHTLHAAYTPNAENVGHFVAVDTTNTDATQLVSDAVIDLLNDVTACTFHMNVAVTGDASTGVVKLDGAVLAYGAADGWAIAPSSHELALRGAACAAFTEGAELTVDLPCDQIEPLDP